MTDERISLQEWIAQSDAGAFESDDFDTQVKAGWYDWFCKESSLAGKTKKLAPKVKQVARSAKIDPTKTYVFFKNNCPMYGKLYDDFRICDLETRDVIYTIIPRSGHTVKAGQAEVWGRENEFEEPLVVGTWNDVREFFGVG